MKNIFIFNKRPPFLSTSQPQHWYSSAAQSKNAYLCAFVCIQTRIFYFGRQHHLRVRAENSLLIQVRVLGKTGKRDNRDHHHQGVIPTYSTRIWQYLDTVHTSKRNTYRLTSPNIAAGENGVTWPTHDPAFWQAAGSIAEHDIILRH